MNISRQIFWIAPSSIKIDRAKRQREIFTTDDLEASIRARGMLNPLIVNGETMVLVAGERRLTTAIKLGLLEVPVRYSQGSDEVTLQIVELEENLARQDLAWTEQAKAIHTIHSLYKQAEEGWTIDKTADALNQAGSWIRRVLAVATEVIADNPKIVSQNGITSAYAVLVAMNERRKEAAEAALTESLKEKPNDLSGVEVEDVRAVIAEAEALGDEDLDIQGLEVETAPTAQTPAPILDLSPIRNLSALEFFAQYNGTPFNLLHCDFPYGIDLQDSDQANSDQHGTYEDSPDVYWDLLKSLAANLDKVMSPHSHMVHWFSPRNGMYEDTRKFFAEMMPDLWVQDIPLVWHKTDNKGIMADVQRRPRNITEFAFLISRGDRKIVESVGNCYGAPTSRLIHQSEKPVPVLRHFFRMVVDETTRLLDPTAGSGNALIAADGMGAQSVLGLELSSEYAAKANASFARYKTLRNLEKSNV